MLLRHNNQKVSLSYNLCPHTCPVYPYWVDSGLGNSIQMLAIRLKSCRSQSSRLAGSRFAKHLEKIMQKGSGRWCLEMLTIRVESTRIESNRVACRRVILLADDSRDTCKTKMLTIPLILVWYKDTRLRNNGMWPKEKTHVCLSLIFCPAVMEIQKIH